MSRRKQTDENGREKEQDKVRWEESNRNIATSIIFELLKKFLI